MLYKCLQRQSHAESEVELLFFCQDTDTIVHWCNLNCNNTTIAINIGLGYNGNILVQSVQNGFAI